MTAYGQRDFAIGDQVVTRRGVRDVRTMDEQRIHVVNGEQWVVVGHRDDGRLALQHARSGVAVAWDMAAYPEVDWSMATTSYRSQGRTVDAAYALVTESDARRGLYVDITRAREDVLVVYAREDLVDFGEFLAIGGRERAKMTVAATQRYLAEHEAVTVDEVNRLLKNGMEQNRESIPSKSAELTKLQEVSAFQQEQRGPQHVQGTFSEAMMNNASLQAASSDASWNATNTTAVSEKEASQSNGEQSPPFAAHEERNREHGASNESLSYVTLSVTRIGWKLEPIADGTATDYSADERRVAKDLMKAMEPLEPQEQLRVARDLHVQLRKPEELRQQIAQTRDAARERTQQRERAQDHDRGFER